MKLACILHIKQVILELGWDQSCDVWSVGCIIFELAMVRNGLLWNRVLRSNKGLHISPLAGFHAFWHAQLCGASCHDGGKKQPSKYQSTILHSEGVGTSSCQDGGALKVEVLLQGTKSNSNLVNNFHMAISRTLPVQGKLKWDEDSSAGRHVRRKVINSDQALNCVTDES